MTVAVATTSSKTRTIVINNHALVVAGSVLFFLPSVLFAAALRPLPAFVTIAGCCGAIALIASTRPENDGLLSKPVDIRRLALCCLCALVILILGGELHLVFTTWDWLTRDAVLADLVRHGFPAGYRVGDADYLLRAPLGMYMVPALVGRAFGLLAAHYALLVQNVLILGTIFYLLASMGEGWGQLVILILFAGVSIVGASLRIAGALPELQPFWLRWGLDSWNPMFQYSGTLVQFFWVPNHALPGWWLAALILLQARRQIDVATLGVSMAGALLWSPLCLVGVVPWLALSVVARPGTILFSGRTWLGALAAVCFVPVLVYLVSGASSIAGGNTYERPDFAFWYMFFVAVQLPVLLFLMLVFRRIAREDRAPLVASAFVLLALPFFRFGPNNDLVMRGSIVALTIVAFVFGRIVVTATRERSLVAWLGWTLVVCSAPSAAVEIGRALATPRYAISDCSLMEATRELIGTGLPTNYIVPKDQLPVWLLDGDATPFREAGARSCWPDRVPPRYFLGV